MKDVDLRTPGIYSGEYVSGDVVKIHPDDFKALVGNRDKKDEPLDSFIDHKKAGQKSEKVLR